MTTNTLAIGALYKPRRDRVEFVDVPELAFLVVPGSGAPEGPAFAEAIQTLYAVSYGAHFILKKRAGEAPRVMPLEALWWVGDDEQQAAIQSVMDGEGTMANTDRDPWQWQAMIMQAAPIDAAVAAEAIAQAHTKDVPALDRVAFRTWEEGRCAQLRHVGPYAAEAPSLHRAAAGRASLNLSSAPDAFCPTGSGPQGLGSRPDRAPRQRDRGGCDGAAPG